MREGNVRKLEGKERHLPEVMSERQRERERERESKMTVG